MKPAYRYPYKPDDGREDLNAYDDIYRVLRGGAFNYARGNVRCADRVRDAPNFRGRDVGCRVVVLPCSGASIVRRGDTLFRAEAKHGRACSWPRLVTPRPGK